MLWVSSQKGRWSCRCKFRAGSGQGRFRKVPGRGGAGSRKVPGRGGGGVGAGSGQVPGRFRKVPGNGLRVKDESRSVNHESCVL